MHLQLCIHHYYTGLNNATIVLQPNNRFDIIRILRNIVFTGCGSVLAIQLHNSSVVFKTKASTTDYKEHCSNGQRCWLHEMPNTIGDNLGPSRVYRVTMHLYYE